MAKPPLERGNTFKRDRYQQLLDAGFPKEWIDELTLHHPSLYDNPKAKIEGLRSRGFENPHKLITTSPSILGYAFENIDAKIAGLRERGFDNPHKLITSSPAILGLAFENIDAKIAGLRERGFDNPHKLITTSPSILGYAFENIDAKIAGLRERGFDNPHKLITSSPAIARSTAMPSTDPSLSSCARDHSTRSVRATDTLRPSRSFSNTSRPLARTTSSAATTTPRHALRRPRLLGRTSLVSS
jgi:hypothetical protein